MRYLVFRGSTSLTGFAVSLLGCVVIAGCGSDQSGPQRVAMEGIVTRDGTPLLSGSISLSPQKGHSGPAVNAGIQDGIYRVSSANGPVAGQYEVLISDNSGLKRDKKLELEADREGRPRPKPGPATKSQSWQFKIDIPDEGAFERDFSLD
ncbi:MAG: hypothetical protein V4719_03385 [Planctomycetota bacterium]